MASKNFSGTLIEPTGELANNDKIMFAQVTTTGEVIAGSVSIVKIGDDGTYDFDLQYGTISISTYNENSRRWIHQGTVTINSDTLVNTLPGLLNAFTPTTPAIVQQLEQILADGQQIIIDAQAQADSASSSALAAEGFKDLAEQAATASANSANQSALNAVENGNVIKAILIAQGLSGEYGYFADGFTLNDPLDVGIDASFQFWKYVGSETLPYAVPQGTDPSAGDWGLVKLNSAKNQTNENGGTVQDFIDLATPSTDFEIFDLNYDQPFRKASDYVVTSAVRGVLHTGQSLAEGGTDGAVISDVTTPSYPDRVLMFSPRPVGLSSTNLSAVTDDLVEATRVTIGHSLTRNLAVGNDDIILFSGQAWGGQPYSTLKKGGSTGVYEATIQQVVNAKAIYPTIVYKAVTNIHGEQDGLNNNTNYALDLNEWRNDYDSDIKAATGQTDDVVMFIDQTSSGSGYGFNGGINELTFPSPLEQLKAHENYPNIILVCPKYFLDYADHSHITNLSQRILGEYHAKAQKLGNAYSPLRPSSVNGSGSSVVIDFVGNVGALAFDTTKVNAATDMGFSYFDDSGRNITAVNITGTNQVTITLDGVIGANPVVAYAYHNGDGGAANQSAGLGDRGNLRDSDTTASLYNPSYILHNWCVTFRTEVTV